jgi:outer membrane protein assembly factor BamA
VLHRRLIAPAAALLVLAFPFTARAKLVVSDLVLEGPAKTKKEVILSRMHLQPGDPVDFAVLDAARERLFASDLFVSVNVWLDMPREEASRKMYLEEAAEPVDVHVALEEKLSWFIVPMGSLGSGDRSAGLAYGDQNVGGQGIAFLVAAQYGQSKSYVVGGLREPIAAFAPLTYGLAGAFRLEDIRFFDNHRLLMHVPTRVEGGEGQIGWVLTPALRVMIGAMYNRVEVFTLRMDDGSASALAYNPKAGNLVLGQLYLLYDATLAPEGLRRGTRVSLRNEVSSGFWKSDFDYVKVDFQMELYGKVLGTYPSLNLRATLNYPTSERGVPLTQLIRLGGSDLRGYQANEFHGDTLLTLQLEDQVPVLTGLKVPLTTSRLNVAAAAFVDVGTLLDRHPAGIASESAPAAMPKLKDLHTGVGAGVRVLVPGIAIPALKLDVAYGIDVKDVAVVVSIAGGSL